MEALKKNHQKIFTLKQAKRVVILLVVTLFFEFFLFPMPTLANYTMEAAIISQEQAVAMENEISQAGPLTSEFNGKLPESNDIPIKWSDHLLITAYNSEAGQTDGSPCITANNFDVCRHGVEDTIAANFLPFGAKIKIPELFGQRIFVVRDRMNQRFSSRVDVWMLNKPDAVKFGVKIAKIEVLE